MTDQGEINENKGEGMDPLKRFETGGRPPVFPAAEYARSLFHRHDIVTSIIPLSQKILSRYSTSHRTVQGKMADLPLVQARHLEGYGLKASNRGMDIKTGVIPTPLPGTFDASDVKPTVHVVQARSIESGGRISKNDSGLETRSKEETPWVTMARNRPIVQAKSSGERRATGPLSSFERPMARKSGEGIAVNPTGTSIRSMISKNVPNISPMEGDRGSQPKEALHVDQAQAGAQPVTTEQAVIVQRQTSGTNQPDMVVKRGVTEANSLAPDNGESSKAEPMAVSESRQPLTVEKNLDGIAVQRKEQAQGIRTETGSAEASVDSKNKSFQVVIPAIQKKTENQGFENTALVFRKENFGDVTGVELVTSSDKTINSSAQTKGQTIRVESQTADVKSQSAGSVVQAKSLENGVAHLPLVQTKIMGREDKGQGLTAERGIGHRVSVIRQAQNVSSSGTTSFLQPLIRPFRPLATGQSNRTGKKETGHVQRKSVGSSWMPIQTAGMVSEPMVQDKVLPVLSVGHPLGGTQENGSAQMKVDRSLDSSSPYENAMDMPMSLGMTGGNVMEKVFQRVENRMNRSEDVQSTGVASAQAPAMPSAAIISEAATAGFGQGSLDIQAMADQVYALIMERLSVERESLGL
ncbi:MAG: hypothetical protein WC799_03425 [Desulfobacteraceae bacterium]|jgi:hypothetical protein